MKKALSSLVVFVLTIALSLSCAKEASESDRSASKGRSERAMLNDREEAPAPEAAGVDQPAPDPGQLAAALENRVRVMTGSLDLIVTDLKPAEEALGVLTKKHAGYVAQSQLSAGSGFLILKIPADRFEACLAEAEKLGTIQKKNVGTEDVTDQYFDLENRIKNKRILLERYQEYLRRAVNTRELLETEQWISNVTTEIEGLEGSFRSLKNSVAYSTLSVSLEIPAERFAADMAATGEFMKKFFYYLGIVLLYTIVISASLILAGGGIYWIGFGRLGLILRFFRALGPKKKSAAGAQAGKG